MERRPIKWLGAPDDACSSYPATLDKSTLQEYGKRCGKQKLKEWITKETGVEVGKCLDGNASLEQSPECIANNYGIKLGVIKDGEVQWDVVVHDAGAVGGIAVCAATGVGAAGLSLCGKIGGELGDIAYTIVEPFVSVFVNFFWGEAEKLTYCNNNHDPPDMLKSNGVDKGGAVAVARWMKSPTLGYLSDTLGSLPFTNVDAIKSYWSKILIMRGLAQASAIVLRDFAEKTGLPASRAISVLDLKAPPGWLELVRPEYDGKPYSDVKLNIGALLDSFMAPEVIRKARGEDVIVPSYLLPAFWSGILSASGVTNVFELQNIEAGCYTAVSWTTRDPKKSKPSSRPYKQAYWEYTTPAVVNALAKADNATFIKAMLAWRDSLKQNLTAKIAEGKKLAVVPSTKGGSALVPVLLVGGAAALAWWLWPGLGLFENPKLPAGATLRQEDGWYVLRFREGGFRRFRTRREALDYVGGLAP